MKKYLPKILFTKKFIRFYLLNITYYPIITFPNSSRVIKYLMFKQNTINCITSLERNFNPLPFRNTTDDYQEIHNEVVKKFFPCVNSRVEVSEQLGKFVSHSSSHDIAIWWYFVCGLLTFHAHIEVVEIKNI